MFHPINEVSIPYRR